MPSTISLARQIANRLNALKSTGPKTEAGKARTRANAVKHGLTGAGIALPGEDAAAVEVRFQAIQEELAPQTMLGTFLAHQMALLTVRSQRAARYEATILTDRAVMALAKFDAARRDRAVQLLGSLGQNLAHFHPLLLAIPEGVDLLIKNLLDLQTVLGSTTLIWDATHEHRLSHYLGDFAPVKTILARALNPATDQPETDAEWCARTTHDMQSLMQAEVARLQAHRTTLDHAAIERERARVLDRVAFDPGKKAILVRKYQATATRELHRSLRDFQIVEASDETDDEPDDEIDTDVDRKLEVGPAPRLTLPTTPQPPLLAPQAVPKPDRKSLPGQDIDEVLASFERAATAELNFVVGRAPAPMPTPSRPLKSPHKRHRHRAN